MRKKKRRKKNKRPPTKKKHKARSCQSKLKHTTEGRAWAAIQSMKHYGVHKGQKPYLCKFCGGWHVGRPTMAERQSAQDKQANRNRGL